MLSRGNIIWAGTANRTAKFFGVASRPDVQAIVMPADEETAELRSRRSGRFRPTSCVTRAV